MGKSLWFPSAFLLLFPLLSPAETPADPNFYPKHIQPLFNSRCVQCHSCYNAPCQLNLSSVEGLNRGMVNGFDVYSPRKFRAEEPSRLGIDRKTVEEWRNFSREYRFKEVAPREAGASFIQITTAHKAAHPELTIDDLTDFKHQAAENSRSCPDTSAKLLAHLRERPNAGMPYGLPPLSDEELELIQTWSAMGSPREEKPNAIPADEATAVRAVEKYLNAYTQNNDEGEARKQSLVSRYLYEHLYLAHLHVKDEADPAHYYRVVRSRTTCETGIDEIPTRRPWNDPEDKFFYCLQPVASTLVHKTHMPYLVDAARLTRWQSLFFSLPWNVAAPEAKGLLSRVFGRRDRGWPVDTAPRSDEAASNPLFVFKDIPVRARYQFLLDDAAYEVDTFIRGPVCKGNTAVNSIDEQFYVFFTKPESDLMVRDEKFAEAAIPTHLLPAFKGSEQIGGVVAGRKIRKAREAYRALRNEALTKEFPQGLGIDDVWNGQTRADQVYGRGANRNAAITVVRNYDSSAVAKGLIGATSKTAFLLDYSLLERLVYVLVTGFDVYGDVGHQMHTRLYMAYLRMEAEENFLNLMPPEVREPMRKSWYVEADGISEKVAKHVNRVLRRDPDKMSRRFPLLGTQLPTRVAHTAFKPEEFYTLGANEQESRLRGYRREVVKQLKAHLGPALTDTGTFNRDKKLEASAAGERVGPINSAAAFEQAIGRLTDLKAAQNPWILYLPSLSYILVETSEGPQLYTLIRNKEHYNIAWIFGEKNRRNKAADSLILYRGVLGSYPNHIFVVEANKAAGFLQKMTEIRDHASYEAWLRDYGAPRSGPGSEKFWAKSDRLHEAFRQLYPKEYGVFDYNRYGMDYRHANDEAEPDDFANNLPAPMKEAVTDAFGD